MVKSIPFGTKSETYYFPPEAQPIKLQEMLLKVPTVARNIAAMNKRGQFRNLTIKLSDESMRRVTLNSRNFFFSLKSNQSLRNDMGLAKYVNRTKC